MKRNEFGELLAALRQDFGWTQFQLAERADVDVAVISQIERGVKRHFEPELLFQLVNAFQLTTLERREFLLAASGLDQTEIVRQPSAAMSTDVFNATKVLEKMIELTGQVRLPAFLADVYGDVVAANNIILSFFKIPPEYLHRYALYSMRTFRENSLRYRAQPYFKYLMKIFRNQNEYPFFERYWKMVSSLEQDKEASMDHFSYRHDEFGPIKYISASTISITSFGELFLVQYLPLDETTSQGFEQIARRAGQVARKFAPWPEKPMP
jgi:transcriptional regulator with XRE-family HTH domain